MKAAKRPAARPAGADKRQSSIPVDALKTTGARVRSFPFTLKLLVTIPGLALVPPPLVTFVSQNSARDIPLGARIIAVADAFDAMTSHRAYRRALSRDKAATILREGAGSQWDADVVNAFLEIIAEKDMDEDDRGTASEELAFN